MRGGPLFMHWHLSWTKTHFRGKCPQEGITITPSRQNPVEVLGYSEREGLMELHQWNATQAIH